ncbi:signal peptidase II [Fundidesulfovibrio terrae]|uniref:signal peptidase II n=1 Tax=Fundidesulfovibrio terrae TaxID=2922866 RepID=UPI001FB017D8
MKPQYILAGSIAAGVTLLDQITKLQVQKHLVLYTSREIIPGFFNLVHTLNKGAAFGFLNRPDTSWQTYFFIAATALAVVIVLNLLSKAEPGAKLFIIALGLILGGALGNLIDRMRTGQVVDFLEFYLGSFVWPAFNVADIAITLGSLAMILSFYGRKRPK